ncbi:MAG TPA: pseudouridine-5'-phosphate glycosidase, partial [Candidatus Sulfomarinibacteraceae bacterium]|nr:pseudouridine-5'-phosphate glycosidase [Candidatus Sulfomarinibacteraceae bacterium]
MNQIIDDYFYIAPQVQEALGEGRPVVALESTVITHGLPYPDNLTTAQSMEDAVREGGALPATIGIISGKIHVGLNEGQLAYLANQADKGARKCSRRDLPLVLTAGHDAGTTVAATMLLAHRADIPIFATGGIGGVHRGHPFDVSADLTELAR